MGCQGVGTGLGDIFGYASLVGAFGHLVCSTVTTALVSLVLLSGAYHRGAKLVVVRAV